MCERLFHGGRSGWVDLYDERLLDSWRSLHVRAASVRALGAQSRRIAMGLCIATRGQCLALRATLPATWTTLFSSVSLLQVYQMGLFQVRAAGLPWSRTRRLGGYHAHLRRWWSRGQLRSKSAPMVWLTLTRVCGTTAPPSKLSILLLCAHQSAVLPPSHQQVPVTIATVSLCRKNALPLAQRAARPS